MELKLEASTSRYCKKVGSNRTFMELKCCIGSTENIINMF